MPWIKQGLIFEREPSEHFTSHAQVPTPFVFDDFIRVYYAARTKENESFIAYFDLTKDLKTILGTHNSSIMEHGEPGMFDSDGMMPSCVIKNGDELWMYYIGWNEKAKGARYQNEIGLAISKDNGETFERMFKGPIIGRSPTEPGLAVMPTVMYKNWYRMWYQSGTGWTKVGDTYEPNYVIKYAESMDGVTWTRYDTQCVQSKYELEAFSRPTVIFEDEKYKMWFCCRDSEDYRGGQGSYRIGYAESDNGIDFERKDNEAGISVSYEDWDSQMICYPYVIELDGKKVMFYNGNDFGQSGIGVAVWN